MSRSSARTLIQAALLRLYAAVRRSGLFETAAGRWLFDRAYHLYKAWLESGDPDLLQRFVTPGSLVIDVGANVGFFTVRFARWAAPDGRVIAIEPEAANLAQLRRNVAAAGLMPAVEIVAAAATDTPGPVRLEINPDHPGDHRLGRTGQAVEGITLDRLAADHGWPAVSLIKIDVQGAELAVIAGARDVLSRFGPALYVEVDDANLNTFGSSAAQLLAALAALGYAPYLWQGRAPVPATRDSLLAHATAGYIDVLFLRRP